MDAAPAPGAAVGRAAGAGDGRRLGLGLFLVSAAQFTLQLDFSIVNVALATIQREFGVSAVDLQWIVTGYALPFGALLLLGGRLGDLTGHRRLLVGGLALFGVTSLLAGLAPDSGVLIAARFAQGASAALVAPMALAAITDLFPDGAGPGARHLPGRDGGGGERGHRARRDLDRVRRLAGDLPGQPAGHRDLGRSGAPAAAARAGPRGRPGRRPARRRRRGAGHGERRRAHLRPEPGPAAGIHRAGHRRRAGGRGGPGGGVRRYRAAGRGADGAGAGTGRPRAAGGARRDVPRRLGGGRLRVLRHPLHAEG